MGLLTVIKDQRSWNYYIDTVVELGLSSIGELTPMIVLKVFQILQFLFQYSMNWRDVFMRELINDDASASHLYCFLLNCNAALLRVVPELL